MEKIVRFPGGGKSAESRHVCGCHGFFFGPEDHCDLKKCDWIPPPYSLFFIGGPNGDRSSRQGPEKGSATGTANKAQPKEQQKRWEPNEKL